METKATRPLKVAVVAACPFPYPRGTPARVFRIAEALSRRGHELHVITYHLGDGRTDLPMTVHRIPNVKTYRKLSPGPTYQKLLVVDFLLAMKLKQVLREYPIDLIHAHHFEGLIVSASVRTRKKHPLIFDAHTLLASELPYYGLGLSTRVKRMIGQRLDRHIPKWSDHVIAVTNRIKNKLVHDGGLAPEDVTVISDGVEPEIFFERGQGEPGCHPKSYGRLIFTGNLSSYQGIDLLLRAFGEIVAKRHEVRLLIVSDSSFDPYEPMARELGIRESIDVETSRFEDLPQHLANADIAVNPRTECDGIPLKLLNYMAAGKPIVSFEGSAEIIENGRTGWVVENGDTSAFADGVLRLLDNFELAQNLGNRAREEVIRKHTWDAKARDTEEVYEQVLHRGLSR